MISGQVAASPVVLFPCCLLPMRGNEWALRDDLVSDGLDDFRGAVWCEKMHEVVSILAITMIPGSRVRNLSFQKQIGRSFWSRHVSLAHPLEILIDAVVDRLIVVDSPKVGQNLAFGRVLMCINVKDDAADIISFAGGSAPHQQTIIIAAQQQQLQMSFFPTEKRRILETTPVNPLGPGKYQSRDDLHHQRPAYAPFGSLSSKKPTSKDSAGIGPGQYNISSPIIRPSITKYENKNIIIVKVNDQGGHQFKSRTNRFIQQHSHTEAGPGSYELDHSPSPPRVRSSSLHPKSKLADRVRAINRQFCQERKPTLLSDPPAQQLREGKGRSQSGGKGVVNWGLNRRQRFDLLVKQPFDQNDKRKALSQFSASRKKKVRPSAVFASKSIKSHLETQIYKTNNSFKAELRKMIDYKDQQPGPGSYEPITPTAGPRVLPRFQFFGSTVQRFPQPEEQVVGPGLYEVGNKIEKTQPRQSISFSEDRHSYLGKNFTPGPGSYEVERAVIGTSFSEKELQPPFGSQQPRFNYKQKEEQTEMEEAAFVMKSYFKEKQAKKEEQIKLLKKIAQDHPSAVFTSQTKRFEGKIADVSTVDVGSYDITQNDITSKVAKHQKLIQQLEECQLHKPPFLSGNPRFKQPQKHESEHRNCWCQVKSVEKQMIDHESPVFISNDRRTTFEQVYKAPPVGYYQSQQQTMIKDSFNSRFRKKQQNAVKKDAKRNRDMSKRLQTQPNHPIGFIGKTVQ